MRRFLVFLGLFTLLLVLGSFGSALMVQFGWMRSLGHRNVGYAAVLPTVAYVVLSLRFLIQGRAPGPRERANETPN